MQLYFEIKSPEGDNDNIFKKIEPFLRGFFGIPSQEMRFFIQKSEIDICPGVLKGKHTTIEFNVVYINDASKKIHGIIILKNHKLIPVILENSSNELLNKLTELKKAFQKEFVI